MSTANHYRGIVYEVPNNDDGAWRVIYPNTELAGLTQMNAVPRRVFATRNEAVRAAEIAIDRALGGPLSTKKKQ
jgi:hypothetical protein